MARSSRNENDTRNGLKPEHSMQHLVQHSVLVLPRLRIHRVRPMRGDAAAFEQQLAGAERRSIG